MQRACQIAVVIAAVLALAACASSNPKLLHLRKDQPGPDEFLILPTKPLDAPANYSTLPPPTPGGTNLADHVPEEDLAVALGGKASAVQPGRGIPAADGTLVASAGRYGLQPDIRSQLAAEDLYFRQHHNSRLLERVFGTNTYFRAYRSQSLDQYAELARLRSLGLQTSQVPPKPKKKKGSSSSNASTIPACSSRRCR
jgi:hypothetical protein